MYQDDDRHFVLKKLLFVVFVVLSIISFILYLIWHMGSDMPVLSHANTVIKVRPSHNQNFVSIEDQKYVYTHLIKGKKSDISAKIMPNPEAPISVNGVEKSDLFETVQVVEVNPANDIFDILDDSSVDIFDMVNVHSHPMRELKVTTTATEDIFHANKKGKFEYYLEVGYARTEQAANAMYQHILLQNKKTIVIYKHKILKAKINDSWFFRVLIGPVATNSEAKLVCKKLTDKKQNCMVMMLETNQN